MEKVLPQKVPLWNEEFLSPDSYLARSEQARAIFLMILRSPADFVAHAQFLDQDMTFSQGRKALRKFDAILSRMTLGSGWAKAPSDLRPFFIAIPEREAGLHYHFGLSIPGKVRIKGVLPWMIARVIETAMRKHYPAFDLKIDAVQEDSYFQFASYAVKRAFDRRTIEEFVISTEFRA